MRSLPAPGRAPLAAAGHTLLLPRGAVFTIEGEPAKAFYIVLAGRVKLARISGHGREQILYIVKAGNHFNMVPIFNGGPCPAMTETLDEIELLVLPRATIERAIVDYPELASALLRELAARLRYMVGLVEVSGCTRSRNGWPGCCCTRRPRLSARRRSRRSRWRRTSAPCVRWVAARSIPSRPRG